MEKKVVALLNGLDCKGRSAYIVLSSRQSLFKLSIQSVSSTDLS